MVTSEVTPKQVWDTLSAVNVNDHTEKKGNLTYLSWTFAYATLMQHFPASSYELGTIEERKDDTVIVHTSVTVEGHTKEMWLPVMDNRNNAVVEPTARQISDALMRCLTKNIAMFGLGLYVYAGEDLPISPDPARVQQAVEVATGSAAMSETMAKKVAEEDAAEDTRRRNAATLKSLYSDGGRFTSLQVQYYLSKQTNSEWRTWTTALMTEFVAFMNKIPEPDIIRDEDARAALAVTEEGK